MILRSRDTCKTRVRLDNIRRLLAELAMRELLADDICDLLKYSPSGARKYIRDLREAGVLELSRYVDGTATYLGKALYRLTPDAERVRMFLAELGHPLQGGTPRPKSSATRIPQAVSSGGRHFHILADDTHYAVRLSSAPAVRDPLVAALFGPAVKL